MIYNFLTFGRNAAPAYARKTILLVDCHSDSLRAMSLALHGEPYRVLTADNAGAAVRIVYAGLPDLIVVDSQVLDADGTRLAKRLLADEELASVPIMALTETPGVMHGKGELRGAYDGHIRKPIEGNTFAAQVRGFFQAWEEGSQRPALDLDLHTDLTISRRIEVAELLDAIETGLPDSQFAPGVRTALGRLADAVGWSHRYELSSYLERAERLADAATARARRRFRSIVRLCREVAERDPDSAPEMAALRAAYLARRRAEFSGLERAGQDGDFATICKAGHNLKGTGTAYGFEEITDIGRSLEASAKDGDSSAIDTLLEQLDCYIGIVRASPEAAEVKATGS